MRAAAMDKPVLGQTPQRKVSSEACGRHHDGAERTETNTADARPRSEYGHVECRGVGILALRGGGPHPAAGVLRWLEESEHGSDPEDVTQMHTRRHGDQRNDCDDGPPGVGVLRWLEEPDTEEEDHVNDQDVIEDWE